MGAAQRCEKQRDLVAREDDGKTNGRFRARNAVEKRQLASNDLAVEEEQRALCLVLHGGGDRQLGRQVRQEGDDCLVAKIRRMAVAVEEAWRRVALRRR